VGTGFGSTAPPVAARTLFSGAPAVQTAPLVTVSGVPAQVINTVLTEGTAGLYLVAIQLPTHFATVPATVQASISGAQSQTSVTIFIGNS